MKTLKRISCMSVVIALIITMASCSLFERKANYTQKIIAGNIEVIIRDDMTEDTSITSQGDSYITCYLWKGYGMNIRSFEAERILLKGKTSDDLLTETLAGQKNLTAIQKYGNISYMEYTLSDGDKEYIFTDFVLEEGSEFYFLEFYTTSESSKKYMEQYQTIVSSVKMIRETRATNTVSIGGITLMIDGDSVDNGNNIYTCSRYKVSAAIYDVPKDFSSEEFCQMTIEQANYKTADGQKVTQINKASDGTSSFECVINTLYSYHYARTDGSKLIYIYFFTKDKADETLKTDFDLIASSSKLSE